jgi:hypothetical protein
MAERSRVVTIALSETELAELMAIQAALGLPYRFFLLYGARQAQRRYAEEQRRQDPQHD